MASPFLASEDMEAPSSPSSLSGPGTTRHNRKLQLRKNGFRGRALANRNITPGRKTSDAWSSPLPNDSTTPDAPPPPDIHIQGFSTRGRSSSILQEVNNSSLRKKAATKAKHDSVLAIFQDEENAPEKPWDLDSSPVCLPAEAPNLLKPRPNHRRSQSYKHANSEADQADQHIAYLEAELAAYQSQLSSLTSPTLAKEKSQKMRLLNLEIHRLQEENTRWENDFDDRLAQLHDEHTVVEAHLRSRIGLLENDTDNYAQKVKELQAQLESTRKSLEIAEAANVEFERRLETFANLLVTSPVKSETPLMQPPLGHERRKSRQQRLSFHRFPTAGALLQQPLVSPSHEEPLQSQPEVIGEHEQAVYDHFDMASDVEWDPSKRASIVSTSSRHSINFDDILNQDPHASASRAKPSRRMRRFHGGSHNPKPLILSAAQLPLLASAPILEPHDLPRNFPFSDVDTLPRRSSFHDFTLLTGRRRARTIADGYEMANIRPVTADAALSSTPLTSNIDQSSTTPAAPVADDDSTPRDYSSFGPNFGRSLLEELRSARDIDNTETSSDPLHVSPESALDVAPMNFDTLSSGHSSGIHRSPSGSIRSRHHRSLSEATGLSMYPSSRRPSEMSPVSSLPSKRTGIFATLHNMYRTPFGVARRCISRAHSTLLLSRRLNRLQWWLVHALLGPMATRRLMACSLHESTLLLSDTHRRRLHPSRRNFTSPIDDDDDGDDHLAYAADSSDSEDQGSPCPTRHARRRTFRSSTTFEQEKKKEIQEAPILSRHSPWLWVRFSLTLAFAVATAIKDGPATLLKPCEEGAGKSCGCLGCAQKSLKKCGKAE